MRFLGLMTILAVLLAGCSGTFSDEKAVTEPPVDDVIDPTNNNGWGNNPPPACNPGSAPTWFKNALCICNDLKKVGAILVRKGPAGDSPTMGVNGKFKVVAHSDIDGSLVAYGGLEAIANTDVLDNLKSNAHVSFAGRMAVGKDMMVGGNLSGIGFLDVGGTLGVGGSDGVLGSKKVGKLGGFSTVAPPCDCSPGKVLDVKGEVAKAKNNNDNHKVGLPNNPSNTIGVTKLVLNTGRYYFGSKKSIGYTNITVNGAVKIYIEGDLDAIGHDRFKLTNHSTLDLYVSGNLRTVGHMLFGDKHHPAALRVYIGGGEKVTMQVGNQVFRGSLYAPNAALAYVGRTKIEGSLMARTLDSVGLLELYFARPTTDDSGKKCTPPGGSPPPKKPDQPDPKDLPMIY
jgi:hypothetical protein